MWGIEQVQPAWGAQEQPCLNKTTVDYYYCYFETELCSPGWPGAHIDLLTSISLAFPSMPGFYKSASDPNLGPHACRAASSPAPDLDDCFVTCVCVCKVHTSNATSMEAGGQYSMSALGFYLACLCHCTHQCGWLGASCLHFSLLRKSTGVTLQTGASQGF